MLRRGLVKWVVLALLLLTQVPMLAAVMLATVNPGSDHEFRASYDQGRIEVTLHHAEEAGRGHRHTGLESVLMDDDAGDGHPDHAISFGSSSPAKTDATETIPASAVGFVPTLVIALDSLAIPDACRSALACGHVHAPPPPGHSRRGVVMRL